MIKDLPGYEGKYAVTDDGRVWSYYRNKWMSPSIGKLGYQNITLWRNSKPFLQGVHRLVAKTFLPNPENKPCINHIDFNPSNNSLENLEWCTYKENIAWTDKFGRRDEGLKRSIKLATAACIKKQSWKKGLEICHKRETWRISSKIGLPLAVEAAKKKQCWKYGVELSKKKTKLFYNGKFIDVFESKRSAATFAAIHGWASKSSLLKYNESGQCAVCYG